MKNRPGGETETRANFDETVCKDDLDYQTDGVEASATIDRVNGASIAYVIMGHWRTDNGSK